MFKEFVKLGKNSMTYGLADIISKTVGFFMIPIYTRWLTPADYGVIAMLMFFNTFVAVILPLGINAAFMRFYFEGKDEKEKHAIYSTALIYVGAIDIIVISMLLVFSGRISLFLFQSAGYSLYVRLMAAALFFQIVQLMSRQLLIAQERAVFYTTFAVVMFLIAISLNILFIVILKMGVLGFIYSSLISAAVSACFIGIFTIAKTGIHFSFHWLKEMQRYGFPLIFSSACLFLYMFSDRFFLQRFSNLAEVGLYSLAFQFGDIINYASSPFIMAQTPFTFAVYKEERSKEMFSRLFTYSFIVLSFFALAISVYIKDVFLIVVGGKFLSAYKLVPILVLSALLRSIYYSLYIGIPLMKKTHLILYIYSMAAMVNILCNIYLIRIWGAWGAAISRVLTFLFLAILAYKISQRLFYIKYEIKRIITITLLGISLYLISMFIPAKSLVLSMSLKTLIIILFPAALLLGGFLNDDEKNKIREIANNIRNIFPKQRGS